MPRRADSRSASAWENVGKALASEILAGAERVVVGGLRQEFGTHSRALIEKVAKKMVEMELGEKAWEKMSAPDRELWVSRAAVAAQSTLQEMSTLAQVLRGKVR